MKDDAKYSAKPSLKNPVLMSMPLNVSYLQPSRAKVNPACTWSERETKGSGRTSRVERRS